MAALALIVSLLSTGGTISAKEREFNIHRESCSVTTGNRVVTLNIEPKPVRPMQKLTFTVTIAPCEALPASLLLDLSMPGMQMGNNQVTLLRKSGCVWEGKGIMVRCMSGRTLWQVTILSDELKNPAFTFNVAK
jgi:CheY-like chemotaxis protein